MATARLKRCSWCGDSELYCAYHDNEWGVPVSEDIKLFEFLILEGAQAGLSWITVLKKRMNYFEAFEGFDPSRVAKFSSRKIESLMKNPGIIRNRLKLNSAVRNAKVFLKIQDEFGGFAPYQWAFVENKPLQNKVRSSKDLPATSKVSDAFSKDLKKRGMNFVGSTILYAHMQAVGMVNDHAADCFRYKAVKALGREFQL